MLPGFVMLHEHMSSGPCRWRRGPTAVQLAPPLSGVRRDDDSNGRDESSIRRVESKTSSRPWGGARARNASDEPVFQWRRQSRFSQTRSFVIQRMRGGLFVTGQRKASPDSEVYQQISKDALAAIIGEAHHLGLPVTAHLGSVTCAKPPSSKSTISSTDSGRARGCPKRISALIPKDLARKVSFGC